MKRTRIHLPACLIGLVLLIAGLSTQTVAQESLSVAAGSRLSIIGSTSVSGFTCSSSEATGFGVVDQIATPSAGVRGTENSSSPRIELKVKTESFDCGKPFMNKDMYKALKSESHPEIEFVLAHAIVDSDRNTETRVSRFKAVGSLSLAGKTRRIEIQGQGEQLSDDRYRLAGNKTLLMSDFDIVPPTALMGLVRTHDRIVVQFDLLVAPNRNFSRSMN
jgi:hypothetical protein